MSENPLNEDPPSYRRGGFQSFENVAADAVLSIHYNSTGTRFATGAADHKLRIYEVEDDGQSKLIDQWRAHDAEVLDVDWPFYLCSHSFPSPLRFCVQLVLALVL